MALCPAPEPPARYVPPHPLVLITSSVTTSSVSEPYQAAGMFTAPAAVAAALTTIVIAIAIDFLMFSVSLRCESCDRASLLGSAMRPRAVTRTGPSPPYLSSCRNTAKTLDEHGILGAGAGPVPSISGKNEPIFRRWVTGDRFLSP